MVALLVILACILVFVIPIVILVCHINKAMDDIMDQEENEKTFYDTPYKN